MLGNFRSAPSLVVENVFCFHVSTHFRRRILAFHDQSKSNPEGELLTPLRLEERADRKFKKNAGFFCLSSGDSATLAGAAHL